MLGAPLGTARAAPPGYFGKIVGFPDFVSRRLPRSFVGPWDDWLQQCVLGSREALGSVWHDTYMTSPIWRFLLSAGVCGPLAWAGVLMPSTDRVGRHFPFTVACELPDSCGRLTLLTETAWFEALEELVLSTLDEPFDLETFDAALQRLAAPSSSGGPLKRLRNDHGGAISWCFGLGSAAAVPQSLPAIADVLAEGALERRTFWWTAGSDKVAPCMLVLGDLPPPTGFAALLDGNWQRSGWTDWI